MSGYLLAIDQGTTSSRAIVFSSHGEPISHHQIDLAQFFPENGWVEQDPMEMWLSTLACCQKALEKQKLSAKDIAAIGITNQRETTIIWDKKTGQPIYPAIIWQDRRTTEICQQFSEQPINSALQAKTGLLLDPYFSATKIIWILNTVPQARARAERGELAFGTVDTFLLWQFTKGKVHATDATNASRTLLFNIHTQTWDNEILNAFNIPEALLPQVFDSSAAFGFSETEFLGSPILIAAMIGDQQAAMVGQACFSPGMIKSTYGTGCFMVLNTGSDVIKSNNKLLTTTLYRLKGQATYGLEGCIFSAGATIKWLCDKLKLLTMAAESESLAMGVSDTEGVYLVPAFTGLGAPYWKPDARAAILGLTCNSNPAHIVRAALEAVGYQTRDLLSAMLADGQSKIKVLRVDGGMVINNWLMQFIADILAVPLQRAACIETTALGAAYLAGLQIGLYHSLDEISQLWREDKVFMPTMKISQSDFLYKGWKKAVEKIID